MDLRIRRDEPKSTLKLQGPTPALKLTIESFELSDEEPYEEDCLVFRMSPCGSLRRRDSPILPSKPIMFVFPPRVGLLRPPSH